MKNTKTLITISGLAAFSLVVSAASLSPRDKEFLRIAATTNMKEAHEGQIAQEHATRNDVKDLGKSLVEDHIRSYWHLKQLATKEGVEIPTGINAAKMPDVALLHHLKGEAFDKRFTQDEISDHKRALALFQAEAKIGQDPEVREFAAKMIPVLEKHIKLAEECKKR